MEKLKRAVIKEELVELTGNFKKAIVLNQMIYWAERSKDADKFISDEKQRAEMAMGKAEMEYAEKLYEVDLMSHGWIYKSAGELSEETMMGVSKSTMGTYLNDLVKKGWLDKRKNPNWKGDNTFQYRVNLVKIQCDLQEIGYSLEGYPLLTDEFKNQTPKSNNRTSKFENRITSSEIEQPVRKSNGQFENRTTLPEITSDITTEIIPDNPYQYLSNYIWNMKVPMELKRYFKNKVKVLIDNQPTFDLSKIEYVYNSYVEYIQPDCQRDNIEFLNDLEFTNTMIKMYEKVTSTGKRIDNMEGLIKSWLLNAISFKKERVENAIMFQDERQESMMQSSYQQNYSGYNFYKDTEL